MRQVVRAAIAVTLMVVVYRSGAQSSSLGAIQQLAASVGTDVRYRCVQVSTMFEILFYIIDHMPFILVNRLWRYLNKYTSCLVEHSK